VFSVGDEVEVIGELDGAGQFLQDVYAEALAAQLGVGVRVAHRTVTGGEKVTQTVFLPSCDQKPLSGSRDHL